MMPKCQHDPKETVGPIGMYHCPLCGDMVIAGFEHPDMDEVDKKYTEYLDNKYEELKNYIKGHIGKATYEAFVMFMESMPNMKGTMMEIWLRADMNEEFNCCNCNRPTFAYRLHCSPFCIKADEIKQKELK